MSFNWDTEENWDEIPTTEKPPTPKKRSLLPYIILLLVVFLIAGWIMTRQLQERVEEVDADVIGDVTSSWQLVRQAHGSGDVELFVTLLSGRDADWATNQQLMFNEGVLFERDGLGLGWQSEASQVISATTSPDLIETTLLVAENYTVEIGNGVTETVQLHHHEVYRLGQERWLFAPPTDEVDSTLLRWESRYVTVEYPAEDGVLGEKLGQDLDAKIQEVCGRLDRATGSFSCDNFQTTVRLVLEPSVLWEDRNRVDGVFLMPAFSLIGMPADEKAYQAIFRAHAQPILSRLLTDASGYTCCQQQQLFEALLDRQLAQLGVKPATLTTADFRQLLDSPLTPRDLSYLWDGQSLAETDALYAGILTAFLLHQSPQNSPIHLQLGLRAVDNYWAWLNLYVGDVDTLDQAWVQFLASRANEGATQPPIPLPNQHIATACRAIGVDNGSSLMLYDPQLRAMQPISLLKQNSVSSRWYQNAILLSLPPATVAPSPLLLQFANGTQTPVLLDAAASIPQGVLFETIATNGNEIFVAISGQLQGFNQVGRVDIEGCKNAGICQLTLLGHNDQPIPSPDGQHTLFWNAAGRPDTIKLDQTDHIVGNGQFPQWLDNNSYAFLQTNPATGKPEIVQANLTESTPNPLLDVNNIMSATQEITTTATIASFAVNPYDSQWLVLELQTTFNENMWVSYNRQTTAISLLQISDKTIETIQFSPNKNWVAIGGISNSSTEKQMIISDLNGEHTNTYLSNYPAFLSNIAWSADGNWVIRGEEHFIALHAPAYDYTHIFAPKQAPCFAAGWVN
jgi:hypothetical protein